LLDSLLQETPAVAVMREDRSRRGRDT